MERFDDSTFTVRLHVLANELHVHVRTLRAAAQDGRLAATFAARPYFGKLMATATRGLRPDSWRRGIAGPSDAAGALVSPCAA
jgi:hypothetical protein